MLRYNGARFLRPPLSLVCGALFLRRLVKGQRGFSPLTTSLAPLGLQRLGRTIRGNIGRHLVGGQRLKRRLPEVERRLRLGSGDRMLCVIARGADLAAGNEGNVINETAAQRSQVGEGRRRRRVRRRRMRGRTRSRRRRMGRRRRRRRDRRRGM